MHTYHCIPTYVYLSINLLSSVHPFVYLLALITLPKMTDTDEKRICTERDFSCPQNANWCNHSKKDTKFAVTRSHNSSLPADFGCVSYIWFPFLVKILCFRPVRSLWFIATGKSGKCQYWHSSWKFVFYPMDENGTMQNYRKSNTNCYFDGEKYVKHTLNHRKNFMKISFCLGSDSVQSMLCTLCVQSMLCTLCVQSMLCTLRVEQLNFNL